MADATDLKSVDRKVVWVRLPPSAPSTMTSLPLPEHIALHRDRMWRRDEDLRVESALDAERFIQDVGFANTLTDARRAGPSLSSRFDSQRIANSDA